jgi:predicted acylesterase/phospholipase RssA
VPVKAFTHPIRTALEGVRASGSIPAVLPPMFTEDGRMLVDGGIVDNIPLAPMKTLRSGPNLVVHFFGRAPAHQRSTFPEPYFPFGAGAGVLCFVNSAVGEFAGLYPSPVRT